jgi:hypothetical protein
MVVEADLQLAGGRTLHYYDTGGGDHAVFWHHGTPNVGSPPEPLFERPLRTGCAGCPMTGPATATRA